MKPEEGSSAMKIPPQVLPVRAQTATAGVRHATGSGASPPRLSHRRKYNKCPRAGRPGRWKTRRKRMSSIDSLFINFVEPGVLFFS